MKTDPATGLPRERRYGSRFWKRLRLEILERDRYECWYPECEVWATVVDHIRPVYPGMSDAEFYDPFNLRASCRPHNVVRGVVARFERETAGLEEPAERRRWTPVTFRDVRR